MGQQQLLLLVLSTVIVGLATVAGIQAFEENQQQATQDALVQRGSALATDILAAANKPKQFNGLTLDAGGNGNESASDVADAIGISTTTPDVDGAGSSGECSIGDPSSGSVELTCSADDAQKNVLIKVEPSATEQIQTKFGSGASY